MKRTSKSFGVAVIAAIGFAALCLTACPQPTGKKSKGDPDTTPPTVLSVTPGGTEADVSGNVVITFSEDMGTAPGTVKLNDTALSGGSWSAKTVFTIPYSGLAGGSLYVIYISGFKDAAGNEMAEDNGNYNFITVGTPPAVTPPVLAGLYKDSDSGELLVAFDKTSAETATSTFTAAITHLNNGGSGSYTLFLDGDVSVTGSSLLSSFQLKIVGLTSNRTISLSADGSPLFTVNSSACLILDNNITLSGRDTNTSALVRVEGGILLMRAGSAITNNTNNTTPPYLCSGGGVYISQGTFIMTGGVIKGNKVNNGTGAGVFIENGTFTMSDGEISGNDASGDGMGGGVLIASGGNFNMTGGVIKGNKAGYGGGGVRPGSSNAIFHMSGGTVYGINAPNEADRNTAKEGEGAALRSSAHDYETQYGTFDGSTFTSKGNFDRTIENTFTVVNGELQ